MTISLSNVPPSNTYQIPPPQRTGQGQNGYAIGHNSPYPVRTIRTSTKITNKGVIRLAIDNGNGTQTWGIKPGLGGTGVRSTSAPGGINVGVKAHGDVLGFTAQAKKPTAAAKKAAKKAAKSA